MPGEYTGADLFADAMEAYGVEYVFGNPGTTELPVIQSVVDSDLEYVLGAHEDIAVGMAAGYASTRRYHYHETDAPATECNPAGVVNLHITPGLAHGIGNVYGASFAGAPLVVTAGNHERDFRHEEPLLYGDLEAMVDQFCKWSDEVLDVGALPTMLRRAMRVALTPPTGPVFLGLPQDVMLQSAAPDAVEPLGPIPTAGGGDPGQVDRAADLLVEADEPVFVLGDEVARAGRGAVDAAVDLAEAAGAAVYAEVLACEVNFPGDHPQWISYMPAAEDLVRQLMDTDTLVFVGTSTHTTLLRHEDPLVSPDTTCVHVSPEAWEVAKNYPADAAVVGDPGLVMDRMADLVADRLPEAEREARVETVREAKAYMSGLMEEISVDEAPDDEPRAGKHELVDALQAVAPEAYVVDEGVTSKYPLLLRWPMAPQQMLSNKGGGLGYGLPAAVGAAIAESQRDQPREVLGYIGDGSYLYYPHTIYSAVRHGVDLTVVVSDNRNYRILKNNTANIYGGDPEDYDYVGMDFEPPVDIPKNAESHGARGHLVETPAEIAPTVEAAMDREGVDVVDVLVHD